MRALLVVLALAGCTEQASTFPPEESASQTDASPSSTETSALARKPSWEGARASGVAFRAAGQEPGWMMDIYSEAREGAIVLLWAYGEHVQQFPAANITFPQAGVEHFETQAGGHTLAVTIRRAPCEDVMSGEAYPSTVEVVIDGTTLNGCGRSV